MTTKDVLGDGTVAIPNLSAGGPPRRIMMPGAFRPNRLGTSDLTREREAVEYL